MKALPAMLALALLSVPLSGGRVRRPDDDEPPPETRSASRSNGYVGHRYVGPRSFPTYERELSASDAAAVEAAKEKRARKAQLRERNSARVAAGRCA